MKPQAALLADRAAPPIVNVKNGEIYPTNYPQKTYGDYSMRNDPKSKGYQTPADLPENIQPILKEGIQKEISKGVLRKKLGKMRHLIVREGIKPEVRQE